MLPRTEDPGQLDSSGGDAFPVLVPERRTVLEKELSERWSSSIPVDSRVKRENYEHSIPVAGQDQKLQVAKELSYDDVTLDGVL